MGASGCRKAKKFRNVLESSGIPVLFFWSLVYFPERWLALFTEFLAKLHKTWAWPGVCAWIIMYKLDVTANGMGLQFMGLDLSQRWGIRLNRSAFCSWHVWFDFWSWGNLLCQLGTKRHTPPSKNLNLVSFGYSLSVYDSPGSCWVLEAEWDQEGYSRGHVYVPAVLPFPMHDPKAPLPATGQARNVIQEKPHLCQWVQ